MDSSVRNFLRWTLLSACLGTAGGLYATLISLTITHLSSLRGTHVFQIPIVMGALGVLAHSIEELRGTGLEIVEERFPDEPIGALKGLGKLVSAGVNIGLGASGGQVGPCLQASSGLGDTVARKLSLNSLERKWTVISAASGGVGGVLCSPVASAFFVVEVLLAREERFDYRLFFPAMLAGACGYSVYEALYGKAYLLIPPHPAYQYLPWHLPRLMIVAAIASSAALAYVKLVKWARRWMTERLRPMPVRTLLAGLGVALIGYFVPTATGLGLDYAAASLTKYPAWWDGVSALAKALATAFTVGSQAPAGLVSPTVCTGTFLGAFLGKTLGPSVYAGAATTLAAFIAATFNTPIAAVVLVIQTFGVDCTVPAAVGAMLGYELLRHEHLLTLPVRRGLRG